MGATLYAMNAGMSEIAGSLRSAGAAAGDPRLVSAAHEFEASLMQEFLKPWQHDALFSDADRDASGMAASGGGSDDDDSPGSEGALMSFATQAMAKEISERGGFGIATKILEHFRTSSVKQTRGGAVKL
jgi:peptidoglycan hydrolase FlgJ